MAKRILLIVTLIALLAVFVLSMVDLDTLYNTFSKDYFKEFGYLETGSKNLVTGIYLDYRLFDSIFEAGILLVAVSGIIWLSSKDVDEHNANFMLDKFRNPEIFITGSRIIFPFLVVFGFYIIINGHLSPGGGFQGGAILATAVLITYYIDPKKETNIRLIVNVEKIIFFLILIVVLISFFTRGALFTNFMPLDSSPELKSIYLVTLNMLIGFKVALGLVAIFSMFLKEGR